MKNGLDLLPPDCVRLEFVAGIEGQILYTNDMGVDGITLGQMHRYD